MSSRLSIANLTVNAGEKTILRRFSVTLQPGKVYAIMGPNGSGKSTLAQTIAGNPTLSAARGSKITFAGKNLLKLSPAERTKLGVFLAFQNPMAIPGITIYQLLRVALDGQKDALTLRKEVQELAAQLKITPELLERPLNEDFSGGEKKKMEVLQAAILGGDLLIFDEIDTGTDVDTLKTIGQFIKKLAKKRIVILITHYTRLLKYCAPDRVIVVKNGQLVKVASGKLAASIEKKGYEQF